MRRSLLLTIMIVAVLLVSGCNLPSPQPDTISTEPLLAVTPAHTKTSPFAPLLTPTPTLAPIKTEEPLVTPTPGLLPGLQYAPLSQGQAVTITAYDMLDLQTGWAEWAAAGEGASGSLLRTEDGGQTWQDVTPPPGYPASSRFFALDGQRAWVVPALFIQGQSVEAGYVWRTLDGGATWLASPPVHLQLQEVSLLEFFSPQALYFLDEQQGWLVVAVGHYMNQDVLAILSTTDGGQTWQKKADKFTMGQGEGQDGGAGMPCQVSGIAFVDPQTGYLAGDCLAVSVDMGFNILATQDGGRTWQEQTLPTPADVPQAVWTAAVNDQRFCAPIRVENTPAGILVQHTCQVLEGSDMMKNYYFLSLLPKGSENWLGWAGENASFATPADGYSLGQLMQNGTRSLSLTADGGKTWQVVDTVTWPEARLDFPASGEGFALAWQWNDERQAYDYALVRTENGGRLWALVEGVVK